MRTFWKRQARERSGERAHERTDESINAGAHLSRLATAKTNRRKNNRIPSQRIVLAGRSDERSSGGNEKWEGNSSKAAVIDVRAPVDPDIVKGEVLLLRHLKDCSVLPGSSSQSFIRGACPRERARKRRL